MNELMIDETAADLAADLIDAEISKCVSNKDVDPDYVDKLRQVQIALDNATKVIIVRPVDYEGEPQCGNVYQFPTPDEYDVDYSDFVA